MNNYLNKYLKYKLKYNTAKQLLAGAASIQAQPYDINRVYDILHQSNKIIGEGSFGIIYEDTDYSYAIKKSIKSTKLEKIYDDIGILKLMSEQQIGPQYICTLIDYLGEYIDISTLDLTQDPNFNKSQTYSYLTIVELYENDLYCFFQNIDMIISLPLIDTILDTVDNLITKLLTIYICSDIKFKNMLYKKIIDRYNVVLCDFDGTNSLSGKSFCINNSSIINDEDARNKTRILILLLLCVSSFDILLVNIEKNMYNYVYKLSHIKPFYYDLLHYYFSFKVNLTSFIQFIEDKNDNKDIDDILYIIYEILNIVLKSNTPLEDILKLHNLLEEKDIPKFSDINPMVIISILINKVKTIAYIKAIIIYLFRDNQTGGDITKLTVSHKFNDLVPFAKGAHSKIYKIEDKVYKVTRKISDTDLEKEIRIYDTYQQKEISAPIHNYFVDIENDLYGYIMDEYESDLENILIICHDKSKIIAYETRIMQLIDNMFDTDYICGDIKFKNMLIKNDIIKLADIDNNFCFDNDNKDNDLKKSFIYLTLLCLLCSINARRLQQSISLNLFKKTNITYILLFNDKIDSINTYISTNQFIMLRAEQPNFFYSQFHYIYILYLKLTTLKKDKVEYTNFTDTYIGDIFNIVMTKILLSKSYIM